LQVNDKIKIILITKLGTV